jgi:hypothetical protein
MEQDSASQTVRFRRMSDGERGSALSEVSLPVNICK